MDEPVKSDATRSAGGGRQPPGTLTRDRILLAALRLVDERGQSALTMRNLADRLGVGTMSLYHHVPDRAALLYGLGELLVSDVRVDAAAGWDDGLRQFMRGIRSVARAHPDAFQLVGMRPLRTVDALPPVEALLAAGARAGRPVRESFYAYRTAAAFARGFALAEILGLTLELGRGEPEAGRPAGDADRFPHIDRAFAAHVTSGHDAAFLYGMEAIIAGSRT